MWETLKVVPADKSNKVEEGIEAIIDMYKLVNPSLESYIDTYHENVGAIYTT